MISDCRFVTLPRKIDPRGSLTFIENVGLSESMPIARIFYIYDVPTGEGRGEHAHKNLHQMFVCLSGSFHIVVDDGVEEKFVHLNRPWRGFYVPPMMWVSVTNFDTGTVCMVVCSEKFDEKDYIRDYDEFLDLTTARKCDRI